MMEAKVTDFFRFKKHNLKTERSLRLPVAKDDNNLQVLSELKHSNLAEEDAEKSIRKLQSTPRSRDVYTSSTVGSKRKAKDKALQKTPSTPSSNDKCTKPVSRSARKRLLGLLLQDDSPQSIHPCKTPKHENVEEKGLFDANDQLTVARNSLFLDDLQTSQIEDNTVSETSVEQTNDSSIDLSVEERIKAIQEKYSKQPDLKAKIQGIQEEGSEFKESLSGTQVPGESSKGWSTESHEETSKKTQESISKLLDIVAKLKETQSERAKRKLSSEIPPDQKYHYLACPPSKSLPLPCKYKILEENFKHSDTIVSMLHNRQEVCTFRKLKQSVQRVTKRIFNKLHLGQIKTVFPEAYHFSLEKKLNVLSGGSSTGDDQLIITPNFDYEEGINRGDVNPLHDQVKKIDVNKEASSSVKKKSFIKMDSQCLTKRQSIFHQNILEITRKHHQEFLANLKPPMHVPSDKILCWHPHFLLDTVPDIPVSPLPEALDNKYLRAKDVFELIKDTADDKVVKAVWDVAEKHSETKPFDRKSQQQTLVQEEVLKGISQDLLEKVCARENIRMERVMTRQPEVEKRLEMLSRLPEMISILRTYFITSQKTTIAIDDVSKKVSDSYQSYITAGTAEQHLHLMADLLPEWISIITFSRGSFVKIDKNEDTRIVIEKINHLIKQEN